MHRRSTTTARGVRRRNCDALKDEVYRQMFRLEEGRAGADLDLAIALTRAWMKLDADSRVASDREWLRRISPLCISMIEGTPGPPASHAD